MEILHVSAECYPAAKVGGLGDVAGALPKYLNKAGVKASVVMPSYKNKFLWENKWDLMHEGDFKMGWQNYHYKILRERTDKLGFHFYEVEIPGLLEEELPYGYANDTERHLGFQIAVLDWINSMSRLPDVVHCHDHHAGLIPFMMDYCFQFERLQEIPNVFTIHNGNYQGVFGWDKKDLIPDFARTNSGMLEWKDDINPMASAIKCCWKFTTVSPGYLEELRHNAFGLESLINSEWKKASGILNGIDTEIWNPETDPMIEKNYHTEKVNKGKRKNKEALCNIFQLDASKPLFTFIGRLVAEKGADLLAPGIEQCVREQNGNITFLILGSGVNEYENALNGLKRSLPENFNCFIGYHERLGRLLYAGADFLLMPSRIEPCGLNQLYALRYGTIPIVHSVGGLKDTVIDYSDEGGFGIRFTQATVEDIGFSVGRAVSLFEDRERLTSIRKKIMSIDHSWEQVVNQYIQLYESLK